MLYSLVKRVLDITISVLALIIFSPFALLCSLAIWLEDRDSIIYSQERIGKDRNLFKIYKFRSMVKNADELLFSNSELYERMRSGSHKMDDDPRVTRIGRFLRKYSIDEFPQFLNVLWGEMSFVGPRAYRPDELEKYERENPSVKNALATILSVKPGITGLWQVSGRSQLSFGERIRLEERYARSRSLLLDFYIILRTPIAVIQAKGAA